MRTDPMTRRARELARYISAVNHHRPYESAELLAVRAAKLTGADRPWPARLRLAGRLARAAMGGKVA